MRVIETLTEDQQARAKKLATAALPAAQELNRRVDETIAQAAHPSTKARRLYDLALQQDDDVLAVFVFGTTVREIPTKDLFGCRTTTEKWWPLQDRFRAVGDAKLSQQHLGKPVSAKDKEVLVPVAAFELLYEKLRATPKQ